jgi:hypothetical protein
MPDFDLTDERRRPRQTSFGSLSAGMIVRGSVPASVLYGTEAPPRTQAPASLREVNAKVSATIAQRPAPPPEPAPVIALKPETTATVPAGQRKAVTVRLDPVHHMRLRLVGSYMHRSAQDILVAALNAYLDKLPASVPGGGSAFAPDAN